MHSVACPQQVPTILRHVWPASLVLSRQLQAAEPSSARGQGQLILLQHQQACDGGWRDHRPPWHEAEDARGGCPTSSHTGPGDCLLGSLNHRSKCISQSSLQGKESILSNTCLATLQTYHSKGKEKSEAFSSKASPSPLSPYTQPGAFLPRGAVESGGFSF